MDCRTNQIRDIYHVVGKLTVVAPILASHEKKNNRNQQNMMNMDTLAIAPKRYLHHSHSNLVLMG